MNYKYIVYISRPDGETEADFRKRYLMEHTHKVLAKEKVTRYIANLSEKIPPILTPESGFGNAGSGVDAVDEIWFDGDDFPVSMYAEENMIIVGGYKTLEHETCSCIADKNYPLEKRTPLYKRLAFLRRADDIDHKQFSEYWKHKHGPLASKLHINGFDRYVQNHIVDTITADTKYWDGIVQMQFFTPEEFAAGFFSAVPNAYEIMIHDTHQFIGAWHEARPAYLLSEYIMKR